MGKNNKFTPIIMGGAVPEPCVQPHAQTQIGDCGCHIGQREPRRYGLPVAPWHACPLHAAAPEMFEALLAVISWGPIPTRGLPMEQARAVEEENHRAKTAIYERAHSLLARIERQSS